MRAAFRPLLSSAAGAMAAVILNKDAPKNSHSFDQMPFAYSSDQIVDLSNGLKEELPTPRIRKITLGKHNLTSLPDWIAECENLEWLDVGGNSLTDLPDSLEKLEKLQVVFAAGNAFNTLPPVLGRIPNLTRVGLRSCGITSIAPEAVPEKVVHFILTGNKLTTIPAAAFARLKHVKKLMLANNQLEELPDAAASMTSLELLRISNNKLQRLPKDLLLLPNLAWIAVAGNPFSSSNLPKRLVPTIASRDFTIQEDSRLGEGASGVVKRGSYQGSAVAIKSFKPLGSDGAAADEIAIYTALQNENIVQAKAVVDGEPPLLLME